ncbi:polysaccharide biosynthesis/export family protein [Salinimicrobium sp. MT39]|uniref:Polysaccharide biosynthesis/export family protein n=1 Tax=Salinimicrobium profundisediminis TaxID=2994553 RepID=A0A9X3CV61_9FLAO|nr:polysaccharide biosynthesis/export family protein [Salinimicrobium profundisediminis]MCX2837452.1 polysaccharide biosynthesis/export family protein [Salinimicrobium profundisediminis]
MSIRQLIVVVSILFFVSSCVPTKRLMYLQEDGKETDSLISIERIQKPYRIQVNDLLSIRVKAIDQDVVGMFNPIGEQNPNATGEERLYYDGFLVDAHGNIRVPTLGEVNVLGFTVEEVREKIEKALLDKYFKEQANIFVTVKLAGIRYTTIGEIGSGTQVIYKEQVTIMEAIAQAGDISEFGDRTDVVIVRQYPGGEKRHHIDLTSIDAMKSPYYYIQPNDLIIVNPLPQKALGLGTTGLEAFRTITTILAFVTSTILLITR